ncbi:MAG: hypothetical protein WBW48_03185 [Anaerolineae bacterium]
MSDLLARLLNRRNTAILVALFILAVVSLLASRASVYHLLLNWTGEEELLPQVRGVFQLASNLTRPQPQTRPYVPVSHAGVCPFGINVFLEQEVEPEKRELSLRMISQAGFKWIRQEFPWEDIEIHGKGDFEDRRNEPYRSAWDKYDNIVELAKRYGLSIIARLSNPPAWSRAAGNEMGPYAPPDNYNDFGDFVYAVVSRYKGRIKYYQIWNEPNIYPEWGEQPVNPEAYTELLKIGYTRAKEADPDCVIISGALASTIELGPRNLNDFIFLQRMYDAGARDYFDILAMQGYGLWSGPYDRRMRPRVINFSRPLYVRDIMVRNGDQNKPIWISEMNWNALPLDHPAYPEYGRVTEEQQARYAVEAYQRIQAEWPWVGVVNFWFFKRASEDEKDQAWYYFRMVEPDFTPLPVYDAMKEYAQEPPVMYPGYHQEDHWAVHYEGAWETVADGQAVLGAYRRGAGAGSGLSFAFRGTELTLVVVKSKAAGALQVIVDDRPPVEIELRSSASEFGVQVPIARGLADGEHRVQITALGEGAALDGFIVR